MPVQGMRLAFPPLPATVTRLEPVITTVVPVTSWLRISPATVSLPVVLAYWSNTLPAYTPLLLNGVVRASSTVFTLA